MQENRPLVTQLQQFTSKVSYSLHVPGHKNGKLSRLPSSISKAMVYDLTELTGLDDLHAPKQSIAEAEKLLTAYHKTKKSVFLVNGSTVGNLAMLYGTCHPGDNVIIQRNCHKSIHNAINLIGINPIYITPVWDSATKTAASIDLIAIKKAIKQYNNISAIVLTTPNYYGVIAEQLEEITTYCHSKNIIVLIDEAHGAHFGVTEHFPKSALDYGADIVVQSAHKTLPAMTMGAYLHINSDRVNQQKILTYLQMLQSSSPSYLIMASLDDARQYKATYTLQDFVYFNEKKQAFIALLQSIEGIQIVCSEDPLKLLVRYQGITGFMLQEKLEKHGVYCELADIYQVLMILPLLKVNISYPFEQIAQAIKEACKDLQYTNMQSPKPSVDYVQNITQPKYGVIEVLHYEQEYVPLQEAIGRTAAETFIPYPPGIPICLAGEVITEDMLKQLTNLNQVGAYFQGEHSLNENLICVVKEV